MICLLIVFITVGLFRYEQEINRRNDAENEFVILKKVRKCSRAGFSKQFKPGLNRFTTVIIVPFAAGRGCELCVKSGN